MSDLKWYQAGDLYTTHPEARMETRFIDGGEYVDRQAYIDMRDENSRLRERITELEANSVLVLKHWEAEEPGDLCFNEVTGLHAEADLYRIAELGAALRMAGQLALDERWNERFPKVFSTMEAALGGFNE